jgi:hypothetical protein
MRRMCLVRILAYAVVAATGSTVLAASLPSGTITCELAPNTTLGLRISPYIDSTPGGRIIMKDTLVGTCDSSGVSGGKGPIDRVEARFLAKLEPGTVCTDLITTPDFGQVKLSFKWKGEIGGRTRTIATSKAHLVLGSWDDPTESLVFTGELFKGAFAVSTTTVRLSLVDPVGFLTPNCPRISGIYYGVDGESSITVP